MMKTTIPIMRSAAANLGCDGGSTGTDRCSSIESSGLLRPLTSHHPVKNERKGVRLAWFESWSFDLVS